MSSDPATRVDPMVALQALAEARALLFAAGEYGADGAGAKGAAEEALGPLFQWAAAKGLVRKYGERAIKKILEAPFVEQFDSAAADAREDEFRE